MFGEFAHITSTVMKMKLMHFVLNISNQGTLKDYFNILNVTPILTTLNTCLDVAITPE